MEVAPIVALAVPAGHAVGDEEPIGQWKPAKQVIGVAEDRLQKYPAGHHVTPAWYTKLVTVRV